MQSWVNNVLQSQISVADRSVQYGDGFFTTMLIMDNHLYNWQAHWWRLETSALRLGFPDLDENKILNLMRSALSEYQQKKAQTSALMMKLIVTRGEGGKGYQSPQNPDLTIIVQISAHPIFKKASDFDNTQPAIELGLCESLSSIQPQLAGLKHLNRLENVLARNELLQTGLPEALMLNANHEVVCATQSNIFLVKGQQLITPNLKQSGVAGTTRFQMAQLAKGCGLEYSEQVVKLIDVVEADEVFLTNALRGVMSVKKFQNSQYRFNVTAQIQQAWLNWQKNNLMFLSESGHD